MSTTVDQRVVEMRFDNDRFEKNVATSMSTLAKLKQSLNLTGASKGLESINAAAKNNNISALGTAAETVGAKFSAMQVMGITAIANLTNSAVNSAKQMVSALTIDPVKTGFSEYELKMDSVKTIVASTGEELSTVNKYLEELNEYSDQTIYSFADMTQNIGKFTNAGVKLEDAVMAIKGISNEAAVSGANANEASRAMYNFAQALSSGYVKLIDWKSIENANMATVEFKQQLIDTAVALGTVTAASDGMYETVEGNAFNATQNFNEVFQDQWMTSEVLVETLKKYADESTEIGAKAKAAAQDVTKLTQVFDILKETAQSGWARTWELLFGDLEEAKALFTPVTNFLSGLIDGMSDARNNLLEAALDSPFASIIKKVEAVSKATEKVVDTTERYADIVQRVMGGEYGDGEDRWRKLTEEGYNWAKVQNMINEQTGSMVRHDEKLWEVSENTNKVRATTIQQIAAMGDAQLRSIGFTEDEIQSLRDLEKIANAAGYSLEQVIENPKLISGRTLLVDAFKNIASTIVEFGRSIKFAWQEVFPPTSLEDRAMKIYNIIARFRKLTDGLKFTLFEEDGKTLTAVGDKLVRTFKGIFAAVDIVATVIGGPLKWAFDAVVKLFGTFNIDILDITASMGDAIVALRDWIDEHNIFLKGIELIAPYIQTAVNAIKEWFNTFRENHGIGENFIDGLVNGIKSGAQRVFNNVVELGKELLNKIKAVLGIHSPSTEMFAVGTYLIEGLVNGIIEGAGKVYTAVKQLGVTIMDVISKSTISDGLSNVKEKIKAFGGQVGEFIKNIDLGKLLAAGLGAGMIVAVFKIADVLNTLASPLEGLGDMFEGLGNMFNGLAKSFRAAAFEKRMNGVLNFAKAIGILALSIFVLASIEPGKLWGAIGALSALALIMGALVTLASFMSKDKDSLIDLDFGMTALGILGIAGAILVLSIALKKLSSIDSADLPKTLGLFASIILGLSGFMVAFGTFVKGKAAQNMDKAGAMLLKMSVAMLLMIAVIKLASKLNGQEVIKGLGVVLAVGLLFTAFIAVSKIAGKNADKAGGMILKMSFAMLLMVAVVKLASGMKQSEINRGVKLIAGVGAIFAGLILVSKIAGKNPSKAGGLLLAMSASILIMGFAIKQMAKIEMGDIVKGLGVITAIGLIYAALIYVSKFSGEHATKAGLMLIIMSGALVLITGVLFLLSKMDTKGAYKALGVVTILGLLFTGLIAVTGIAKTDKMLGVLIVMTVAITLLAGAVIALSLIDAQSLRNGTAALSAVIVAFSLLIAATSLVKEPVKMLGTLISLTLVVAALALVIWALSKVDATNVIPNCIGLGMLLTAVSGVLVLLDKMKVGKAFTGVASLLAMAVPLAAFVGVLYLMQNIDNALKNAVALTLLATAMTLLLIPLSIVGANIAGAMLGVVSLVAMAVPLLAFVGVLSLMDGLENAMTNTVALIALSTALTLLLIPLSVIGAVAVAALAGVGALLAMAVPLVAFVGVLYLMEGLENATANAHLLIDMMTVMTEVLTVLAIVGPLAIIGEAAMLGLVALMGVVATFATAVGALTTWFPSLEEFLNKGLGLLSDVAYGIGKFAGDLIAGFADGVMEILPTLGTKLSEFMTNVQGFIEGARSIDDAVVSGVNCLAKAILAITAAELLNGLVSFFPWAPSMGELGTQLSEFMNNAQGFIEGAKSLDDSMLTGVQSLAKVILTLTAVDVLQGLTSWITGGSSLADFGEQLPQLGDDISGFAKNLGTFSEAQTSAVNFAAQAIVNLAEAAQNIPNEGGWAAKIFGENSIATFGEKLPALGANLRAFVTNLGTFSDAQVSTIACAADGVVALAEAAQNIPNEGGWAAKIVGENSIGAFGAKLPALGANLRSFVANLGVFTEAQVTTVDSASQAIVKMAEAAQNIPNEGGWVAKILGDNSIATFGSRLPSLGKDLAAFATNLGTFSSNQVATVGSAANAIQVMAAAAQDIDGQSGWAKKLFGDNGLASFGTELGSLGNSLKTFVTNLGTFSWNQVQTVEAAVGAINAFAGLADTNLKDAKKNVSGFGDEVVDLAYDLKDFIANMPLTASVTTAVTNMKTLLSAINELSGANATGATDFTNGLKKMAKNAIQAFIDAFDTSASDATKAAKTLADAAIDGIEAKETGMRTAGETLATKITEGIESKRFGIKDAAEDAASDAESAVRKCYGDFKSAGIYLTDGFAAGINENTWYVKARAAAMAQAALQAAEDTLDINSPSREFFKIGNYTVAGFVNALVAGTSSVATAGSEMAEAAKVGLNEAIGQIINVLNTDMDVHPTVRPVMDLSNINAGMSAIDGMFNTKHSVGVMANLNNINSTMGNNHQNGNVDVISAINKLGRQLSASQGNVYNINGITYDDGSNITNAIETIVRAARVERRA